jgi:hypothetical protein
MNLWITSNIKFGHKYTTNPINRTNILKSIDWLNDFLNKKSSTGDMLIISGGLFSSTNPSLIAINDAKISLEKLSRNITVLLINSSRDVKKFDGELYSTLNLINLPNVNIITEITGVENIIIKPFEKNGTYDKYIDSGTNKFNDVEIPNLLQLDEGDANAGVLIYNSNTSKHIFVENKFTPKHLNINITTFEELKNLDKDYLKKHVVHLTINSSVFENKEADIEIFKLNPVSIKYIENSEKKKDDIIDFTTDIKQMILDYIEGDEKMMEQFNRIVEISRK